MAALLLRLRSFVRRNPARIYAVAVAAFVLLAAYGITLPTEAWLGLLAALLALAGGEAVQRVEDVKTATGAADRDGGT